MGDDSSGSGNPKYKYRKVTMAVAPRQALKIRFHTCGSNVVLHTISMSVQATLKQFLRTCYRWSNMSF
jgi:hypothetical protein